MRTTRECDKLAEALGCGKYYAKYDKKEEDRVNWVSGCLIATGALGAGVDVNGIKFVLHVGLPYGLINYDQESGRGGRQGEDVLAIICLTVTDFQKLKKQNPEYMTLDDKMMREFVVGDGCRRLVLTGYLSGEEHAKTCIEIDGLLCDYCIRNAISKQALKRQMMEKEEREGKIKRQKRYEGHREYVCRMEMIQGVLFEEVRDICEELQERCSVCWLRKDGFEEMDHPFDKCPEIEMLVGSSWGEFRRKVQFPANSCCFQCGQPGDMCRFASMGMACTDQEVVLPLAIAAWLDEEVDYRTSIEEYAGRRFINVKDYCKWVGRYRVMFQHNATNAYGVFSLVVHEEIKREKGKGIEEEMDVDDEDEDKWSGIWGGLEDEDLYG